MNTYSNESNAPMPQQDKSNNTQPPKDNRKLIYGILLLLLLGTWTYILFSKSKDSNVQENLQSQLDNSDSARQAIETDYNNALLRLDSLTGSNVQMQGDLAEKQEEINNLKAQIRSELNSKNGDLSKAKALIAELKGKVNSLMEEVARLKEENETLTANNKDLTSQRDTLFSQKNKLSSDLDQQKVQTEHFRDEASTLHASKFNIAAVQVKSNGKEKETDKAKKANVLRISFSLNENNVATSGTKELYMILTSPSGNVVTIPSEGSGTFHTRTEGSKTYTTKINVNYVQGTEVPVRFDWHQSGRFETGVYHIAIYNNGYKIGEGAKELKKSGFLGL